MKKMLLVLALVLMFASNPSATADNSELNFETVCLTNAAPTARLDLMYRHGTVKLHPAILMLGSLKSNQPPDWSTNLLKEGDGGLFTCLDPANGKDLFSERLDAPGQYAASPVAADGRIYAASENGVITVLEAGDKLRILAKNDLGEKIFATPALRERRLYARTTSHLYAFGE